MRTITHKKLFFLLSMFVGAITAAPNYKCNIASIKKDLPVKYMTESGTDGYLQHNLDHSIWAIFDGSYKAFIVKNGHSIQGDAAYSNAADVYFALKDAFTQQRKLSN